MAGRNLEDVFDYFVPPDEQRAAREKVDAPAESLAPTPRTPTSTPTRWCLATQPERLLSCALVVDLVAGLARDGRPALVLSSFARPALVPRCEWEEVTAGESGPGPELAAALDEHPGAHVVVAVRPEELPGVIAATGAARLGGVMLAADTRPGGLRGALGQFRRIRAPAALRMGTVLIGATDSEASGAFRVLEGAARRQLGRAVEALGALRDDDSSRRALLRGQSTLDVDPESDSARRILDLCARLRSPAEAVR
jgi:hypothetical protein